MSRTTMPHSIQRLIAGPALLLALAAGMVVAAETPGVLNGIDVLDRDGFKVLDGAKVGLITNHTGLDVNGKSTIELINAAPNVTLVTLFSPEHGLQGVKDEHVGDSTDPLSGKKEYTMYG